MRKFIIATLFCSIGCDDPEAADPIDPMCAQAAENLRGWAIGWDNGYKGFPFWRCIDDAQTNDIECGLSNAFGVVFGLCDSFIDQHGNPLPNQDVPWCLDPEQLEEVRAELDAALLVKIADCMDTSSKE